jgi:hypothetical protein
MIFRIHVWAVFCGKEFLPDSVQLKRLQSINHFRRSQGWTKSDWRRARAAGTVKVCKLTATEHPHKKGKQ